MSELAEELSELAEELSEPVEGVSVLEPPQEARDSVMAAARTRASNFFFIVIFSFCPYPDEFIKLDAFQKTRGALSVEQSPLAFNECKPYARQNACSVSAL